MKRLLPFALPLLLLAGCSTRLTPERLSSSVGQTFTALYVTQQLDVGRTDVSATYIRPTTGCLRNGLQFTGAGEDWVCHVQYSDQNSPYTASFEVQLKTDGCWKATAPVAAQPPQIIDSFTGQGITNPLAEFDGCLDTSW